MDNQADGPRVVRPIPRRPFDLNLTSATPPDEDSAPGTPSNGVDHHRTSPGPRAGFLDARQDEDSLSRAASLMNLAAPTLFGIYSPSVGGREGRGFDADDRDEPSTPWGTGAMTPSLGPGLDDATFEVMRERSRSGFGEADMKFRRPSQPAGANAHAHAHAHAAVAASAAQPKRAVASSLAARAALLFALGVGYGMLVTRLQGDRELGLGASFGVVEGARLAPAAGGYDWRYLVFWGVAGVTLGGLLPWFDGVWEENFGKLDGPARRVGGDGDGQGSSSPETDWALVIRGIGAFVGIVFAIRKLPWTSTMQVSVTLALANPFLWYIIDRSKPGFWLSAIVGLVGMAVLMGLDPGIMPAPMGFSPGASPSRNSTSRQNAESATIAALASHETIETGIWMVSVLFCSCVFFGNIGRRLALGRSSTPRGRWGGVR